MAERTMGTVWSRMGGWELLSPEIRPLWAIEPNVEDLALYEANVRAERTINGDLRNVDPAELPRPDILCAHLEAIPREKYGVSDEDIKPLFRLIRHMKPAHFMAYSFGNIVRDRIVRGLDELFAELGYVCETWHPEVAGYVPARVDRVSVYRASKGLFLPIITPRSRQSWHAAIADLIPTFEAIDVPPAAAKLLRKAEAALDPRSYPILARTDGVPGHVLAPWHEPGYAPHRNPHVVRLGPGQPWLRVSQEAYKRLMGYPASYRWQDVERPIVASKRMKWGETKFAQCLRGTIPPPLARALLATL